MIITIDGPAGAGKSSTAKKLAQRVGFHFLDTGEMYRAATLAGLRVAIDWSDTDAVAQLAKDSRIELTDAEVRLNGEDVTNEIRQPEITAEVYRVADNPLVREHLVRLQREIAEMGDYVTEGRDQGTIVFPDAPLKFFLNASPQERARRRWRDLANRGVMLDYEQVLAEQNDRDSRDLSRPVGRLEQAPDAIEIVTDGLSETEVVDLLRTAVEKHRQKSG